MKRVAKRQVGWALAVVTLAGIAPEVFAQGNGAAGIEAATAEVTSYFDPATKLMYAVGAVLGLIGGVKVYSKWNSGDPDTQKVAAGWFGSCIFLVIVATVLRSFFL
ncbi:DUF4134 domain-containing protein [Rufibacter latericius]|uniref:DUF4134 domain-containing protein n=1 Tax=Rufibacter latericius TaxID=2487040 RepID=A0A3M9MEX4_9BACT|nr:DUF4134 domain-containing protein [Rufibacter latericius]RNI24109.1 DUF4134 domain-containing protein [Rufibacter latericius]